MKKDSSDESEKIKPVKGKDSKKKLAKVQRSDSSEESEIVKPVKGKANQKVLKKVKDSSDESEEVSVKGKTNQKNLAKAKKNDSSDESEEVKPAKEIKKDVKKNNKPKKDSSSEESEIIKPGAKPLKKAVETKKKDSSSSEESEKIQKKPLKPQKPVKEDSESPYSSSGDVPLPQKRAPVTSSIQPIKKVAVSEPLKASNSHETEVFIGGISYEATQEDLAKLFEHCGEISDISIPTRGGKPGGIGFVTFTTSQGAQEATKLNGTEHMGRTVRINLSSQKPDRLVPRVEGATLFMGNLSYHTTEQSIYDFFLGCGNIKNVRIGKDPEGNSRGFAHVEFHSPEEANEALKLNENVLDERPVKLDLAGNKSNGPSTGGDLRVRPATGRPKENMKKSGALQEFQGKKVKL